MSGFRSGSRVVGALGSVTVLALLTGCSSGAAPVRIENHCDVPVQVSYSTFVVEDPKDSVGPPHIETAVADDAAVEVGANASATLKPDIGGDGWLVLRRDGGEWLMVAPLNSEAPADSDVGFIKDGVFVINDVLCAQGDDLAPVSIQATPAP